MQKCIDKLRRNCHAEEVMKNLSAWGFTLIELMVTVTIIAILATIGLTLYNSVQQNARDGKRISDIQEIQKALESYYTQNSGYPQPAAADPPVAAPLNISTDTTVVPKIKVQFQGQTVPADPKSGNKYEYYWCAGTTVASNYMLCATLDSCGKKCNAAAALSLSCGPPPVSPTFTPGTTGTGARYCVSSLSE